MVCCREVQGLTYICTRSPVNSEAEKSVRAVGRTGSLAAAACELNVFAPHRNAIWMLESSSEGLRMVIGFLTQVLS